MAADVVVLLGHEGGPECAIDANPVTLVVRAPAIDPLRSVFVSNENVGSSLSGQVELDR